MPRDGTGVYTYPAGTEGVPDTTIESSKYNAYLNDAQNDANNPRPIIAGGTGAGTAADARANLGAMPLTGGTMTGNVTIAPSAGHATLTLTKSASGQSAYIQSYTAANLRWQMHLGEGSPETGANAGSEFVLNRYSDAGTLLGSPLIINRATGATSINGATTVNGALTLNGAATINGATTITGAVNVTGEVVLAGGDTWLRRVTNAAHGLLHFGNSGVKYIYYDGANFNFIGGAILANSQSIQAGTSLHAATSIHAGTSIHAATSINAGGAVNGGGHSTFGNVTAQGGVVYLNAANTDYIQASGFVLNYRGQVIYHTGNLPASVNSYGNYWVHAGDSVFAAFADGGTHRETYGPHAFVAGMWSGGSSGHGARYRHLFYNTPGGYVVAGAAS